jgi:hypothetical protein
MKHIHTDVMVAPLVSDAVPSLRQINAHSPMYPVPFMTAVNKCRTVVDEFHGLEHFIHSCIGCQRSRGR